MSNVVSIGLPRRPNLEQRQTALLSNFATHRRRKDDVFWLKENAELLNVLTSSGAALKPESLAVYSEFYEGLEERLRFFPQYYRFLLSICLDLESLGYPGEKSSKLCERVKDLRLAECELSDLQRAEAERLLNQRGCGASDVALADRLMRFVEQSQVFALPNKKAAYELTHIIFYLSNYGAKSIDLSSAAITSLEYAGVLAYLDQDIDLLSEICVALRFAGKTPSDIWEDWIAHELGGFVLSSAPEGPVNDAYHEYLVGNWWASVSGLAGFAGTPQKGGLEIARHQSSTGPLRAMSEVMYQMGHARSDDWSCMREILERSLPEEQAHVLLEAEQSSARFGEFFQEFSRV